jgi:hypothetical protein
MIFLLPFAAADIPWVVRSYRANHVFHPLTNGVYGAAFSATPYYAASRCCRAMAAFAASGTPRPTSAGSVFVNQREGHGPWRTTTIAACVALIPGHNEDSLRSFATLLMRARDLQQPQEVRDSAAAASHRWADAYRLAYRHGDPSSTT